MQSIDLETDLFNDLPCFIKGHNTSNVSHIFVAKGQSTIIFPKEKHAGKNVDKKNDVGKEEDQFWDELDEFYLNLYDKTTF